MSGPSPTGSADTVFAQHLASLPSGAEADIEALCREHPDLALDLRAVNQNYQALLPVLRLAGLDPHPQRRLADEIRSRFGDEADPHVSLEGAPSEASSPSTELLKRLEAHAPSNFRYRLIGEVGRGGMGAVLRVWDEDLRRTLAMKVVLGKEDSAATGNTPPVDSRTLGRFLEEAQVTGQLDHPGIVPVHELGLDSGGRVYFTMKLVKGEDLRAIYEYVLTGKDGWNQTRALGVLLKVCEALSYAHDKGVIHRDLKPANVMVGKYGEVYVMDWGLARVLGKKDQHDLRIQAEPKTSVSVQTERRAEREETPDSPILTLDGDVVGTPAYMPPEQARGDAAALGAQSDVYAVGAMLYHLLAGQMPFVPRNAKVSARTVLMRVLEGPPVAVHTLAPGSPAELNAICEKAMAREAAQRYPDTLAMANDLRAFLEHRVVGAYETGTWAETRKWVQRNKPLAASLATVVLLLVAGLTILLAANTTIQAKNTELGAKNIALDAATKSAQASEKTATEQEALARSAEAKSRAEMVNVLKLSAFQTLDDLTKEAQELWPPGPGLVERYRAWMRKAGQLVEKLPEFRASLADIEQRALPQNEDERVEEPSTRPTWRFAEDAGGAETGDRWWHAQMLKLVAALESFQDPKTGLMLGVSEAHGWGVGKRLEFASSVEERTVSGEQARRLWSAAIAAIVASPKYGGLSLAPQLGLLPIGADPESGLWEFAHVQSGEPAGREMDGKLKPSEEMGLVFVLIPGGTFWMGAQRTDRNDRNYDPLASADEAPVHEVALSPYFLSKYEMTQGQWERFTGKNPSQYQKANYSISWSRTGHGWSAQHPVEQVSWTNCMEVLGRLGCELPTEAQWENGCRGGMSSVYWNGDGLEGFAEVANVSDAYAHARGGGSFPVWEQDLDDGNSVHAEVGSYRANAYGLHDVHGNVWEWCRDAYAGYSPGKQVDPVTRGVGASNRVDRGGSFFFGASLARSALRNISTPEFQYGDLGLRPARAVLP